MPHATSNRSHNNNSSPSDDMQAAMASSQNGTSTPTIASATYISHYNSYIEKERQAREEERAMWDLERNALNERIRRLEMDVKRLEAVTLNQRALLAKQIPTHTFPNASKNASTCQSSDNFSLIPGAQTTEKRILKDPIPQNDYKISLLKYDTRDLEGIPLKIPFVNPPPKILFKSSPELSPCSDSPPPTKPLRQARLPVMNKLNSDPYTCDAGHTPSVRDTQSTRDADGANDVDAPVKSQVGNAQTLDSETELSPVKRPSEGQESYFPDLEEADKCGVGDPDPALTGQLGLTNEKEKDIAFLNEVNDLLSQSFEPADVEVAAAGLKSDNVSSG